MCGLFQISPSHPVTASITDAGKPSAHTPRTLWPGLAQDNVLAGDGRVVISQPDAGPALVRLPSQVSMDQLPSLLQGEHHTRLT